MERFVESEFSMWFALAYVPVTGLTKTSFRLVVSLYQMKLAAS